MKVGAVCTYCEADFAIEAGALNRARARGLNIYCGRECSGLGRRKWKSLEVRRAEKTAYDAEYRRRDPERLKARKQDYHRRTYDPRRAAVERKRKMPSHIEYCRQPAYRAYKKQYDRVYRAKNYYGQLWECFLLTQDIRGAVLEKMTDYEVRLSKGTLSKSQKRKRDYEKSLRPKPEIGPLGNLERGERR